MNRKPIGLSVPHRAVIDKSAAKRIAAVVRPWVGLTNEEVRQLIEQTREDKFETNVKDYNERLIERVTAKLREKNT